MSNAEMIRALTHAKAEFQIRTLALILGTPCDSGSGRNGENSRSEVEAESPQSGDAVASPELSAEIPSTTTPTAEGMEWGEGK
jgi:hypothetical protein